MKNKDFKQTIWDKANYAQEYPNDYLVIPAIEVNEMFNEFIKQLKENHTYGTEIIISIKDLDKLAWKKDGKGK